MPASPRAWLISTGKFKALNALRQQGRVKALQPEIASRLDELDDENAARAATEIEDDRLRLIFTCFSPAISYAKCVGDRFLARFWRPLSIGVILVRLLVKVGK